jgi:branched-chain amino acid transport system substrate-binding protein
VKKVQWLGVFALTSLVAGILQPANGQTNVKIGIINSFSGFLAATGDQMQKGIDLYLKEHLMDLPPGVSVEVVRRDDGASPEIGKRVAQELITRDKVNILLGVVSSPIASAIAPLTAEAKIPFVITNAAGVSIPRISPYVVRVSFTLWQMSLPLGKWTSGQGWKRAVTAVSDFIPGHDAENAFKKGFGDANGEVIQSIRFPTNNPDFAPVLERVKNAKPDVLFVWVPAGTQATAMVKTIKDLGLLDSGIKIISTQDLVPDQELPNMGNAPLGFVTAGNYSSAASREANETFLAAWSKAYGSKSTPDYGAVGGWDGMSAVFEVIKRTKGKFTGEEAMAILGRWQSSDSPRGPISIDPMTRDIIQNVYLRRTELKDGKLVNTEFETIPAVKDPWKELHPPS